MAVQKFNKRYLSTLIDRFFPKFIKEKYPKYKLFIKYWFEYIESDDKAFENISNFIKFIDIDKIDDITSSTLKEKILDQIYKQFLGSTETRYLSTLLDDILYLKNQKSILKRKGTKASFFFFFLLVLDGYLKIENIDGDSKVHNSVFQHNGIITYLYSSDYVEPFVYEIVSDLYPSDYNQIVDALNPAGFYPLKILQRQYIYDYDDSGAESISTIFAKPNIYLSIYDVNDNFIGIVKYATIKAAEKLGMDATSSDLTLQNGVQYNLFDSVSGDTDNIYYNFYFNKTQFTDNFKTVKIVSDPQVSGVSATDYFYSSIDSEGEVLFENIDFKINDEESVEVVNNTNLTIMVEFQ